MAGDKLTRDIEEPEEILDALEPRALAFWEKKQRELITSVVDYNLETLASLIRDHAINLRPYYQRRFRWSPEKQSKLIESFLVNVPIPPVFLNEDAFGKYSVIDGAQRLGTVSSFLMGDLKLTGLEIFSDLNGQRFPDLPSDLQSILRTRPTLRAVILLRQSDKDLKIEVFQRLNTGGVRLNPQELRNSTYAGPLNDLILRLSENREFHSLLGIKDKNRSAIYLEMRDAELVLRFFAFKDHWERVSGGMKVQMDDFMDKKRNPPRSELSNLERDFTETLCFVGEVFGEHAFRRWQAQRGSWKKQVLAALYDAEMFACYSLKAKRPVRKPASFLREFQSLFLDKDFLKAINAATNQPSLFRMRIEAVQRLLVAHTR